MTRNALRALALAIALAAIGVAVFRGVTAPDGTFLGAANRTLDVVAWWMLFVAVPGICILDALHVDQAAWWRAKHSKPTWIALLAYIPALAPMTYITVVRPRLTRSQRMKSATRGMGADSVLGTKQTMTFYEPNRDIHETGAEVAEFDDAPPVDAPREAEEDAPEDGATDKAPASSDEHGSDQRGEHRPAIDSE